MIRLAMITLSTALVRNCVGVYLTYIVADRFVFDIVLDIAVGAK